MHVIIFANTNTNVHHQMLQICIHLKCFYRTVISLLTLEITLTAYIWEIALTAYIGDTLCEKLEVEMLVYIHIM